METYPSTPYIPEVRWYDQVDVPGHYYDMRSADRARLLTRLSTWTVESTAAQEAEGAIDARRDANSPLVHKLGARAFFGTEGMAAGFGNGTADVTNIVLEAIGARDMAPAH